MVDPVMCGDKLGVAQHNYPLLHVYDSMYCVFKKTLNMKMRNIMSVLGVLIVSSVTN